MVHLPLLRPFLPVISALGILAVSMSGCSRPAGSTKPGQDSLVYVGTNLGADQPNTIFLYRLSATTGALTRVSAQAGGPNPTYLTMTPGRNLLYAVNETQNYNGTNSGAVSAFAVDRRTGSLTRLNQQSSGGGSPCYISLDRTGKTALVANYMGGNVSALPVQANGQLSAPTTQQHQGSGPHPNQTGPHAHCLLPDPTNKYAFAVDLGTDQVIGYRLNATSSQLTRLPEPAFQTKPGAGPRHLVFHPNARLAFLLNELNSTVTALAYDATTGKFQERQTLSALPTDFTAVNSGADLHVSPDGRFLYTSNRGHNSIAVFRIDTERGTLTLVQHMSTQGNTPRNFSFDPTGSLLLVANQNSNNIVTFRVDKQTGQLTPTGQTAEVPSPMFLQVVEDFTK